MEGGSSDGSGGKDPCWKYCSIPNPNNKQRLQCNFCGGVYYGGIRRIKEHLGGVGNNAKACGKVPPAIRDEMKEYMQMKKQLKDQLDIDKLARARRDNYIEEPLIDMEDEDCDDFEQPTGQGSGRKRTVVGSSMGETAPTKKTNMKGPINLFFAAKGQKTSTNMKEQREVNERARKQLRGKACQSIARFFLDAGFTFHCARYPSFQVMINDIGQYGPDMKAPSYHELRVTLLQREVDITKKAMEEHEKEWDQVGCTLMADGWKDRRERSIINFLANSPKGSMFLESIDASDYAKTGEKLFELLSERVETVGPHRVIQVVTDSASNMKLAGKLLEVKYPHLFWTPCAAHCIDLMLEDLFKISVLKKTHRNACKLTSFVYNRPGVVNMMRKFTKGFELLRPAKTRFATAFIVMSRIHQLKNQLRTMFTSEEWLKSKWGKEAEGKAVTKFIMSTQFWNNIVYAIKIAAPLVEVLRLVDGEKKPSMGYIYEAMDRAKETIAKNFQNNETKYRPIFDIIDEKWNVQLHQPLHAAGNYLNPEFFYKDNHDPTGEVFEGFMHCVKRMYPNVQEQDEIARELEDYKYAQGLFGSEWAVRHRCTKSPAEWWDCYGKRAPMLQRFAKRVLSLTCSSSGCERNFACFEHLHSKKRNRLSQKRLNDLVFVKYNRALRRRFDQRDILDPIALEQVDDNSEFLTGILEEDNDQDETEVHEGLTWGDVAKASGANEPNRSLRSNATVSTTPTPVLAMKKRASKASTSGIGSSRKSPLALVDEDDEGEEEEEECEEPTSVAPVTVDLVDEDDDEDDEGESGI